MIYVRNLQLLSAYRCLKPFTIEFRDDLNVLVGENGSGKSTLLELLHKGEEEKLVRLDRLEGFDFYYMDTERMNPRVKDVQLAPHGKVGSYLSSHFRSHGEVMLPMLRGTRSMRNALVLLDEPEAGLSIKNQGLVLKALWKSMTQRCQVIVATHSYVIIRSVQDVYSMDSMKWISSSDYLKGVGL